MIHEYVVDLNQWYKPHVDSLVLTMKNMTSVQLGEFRSESEARVSYAIEVSRAFNLSISFSLFTLRHNQSSRALFYFWKTIASSQEDPMIAELRSLRQNRCDAYGTSLLHTHIPDIRHPLASSRSCTEWAGRKIWPIFKRVTAVTVSVTLYISPLWTRHKS